MNMKMKTGRLHSENERSGGGINVRRLALIAMFSSLAAVVMLLQVPLPFAPPFYKLDFSEVVVLTGAFALGPLAGVIIEFLKITVNSLIEGTTTGYVGEFANFIMGCSFIVPASIVYHFNRSKKGAVLGMGAGVMSLAVTAGLVNAFIMLPLYALLLNRPLDYFIGMGTDKNGLVKDLPTFILLITVPFNLVKSIASSIVTFLVYKRLSPLIKRMAKK